MIDTIKTIIPLELPKEAYKFFTPYPFALLNGAHGYFKAVCNPSSEARRNCKYEPRLTYIQRSPSNRELTIELSLPKALFNNNFEELIDRDYPQIIGWIKGFLREKNIYVRSAQIEKARVSSIHFGKNIIFNDFTSVSSIINAISKANLSKVYDVQKTDFRNGGQIFHIHTNSQEVVFYDKLADLDQSRKSEKRSTEKNNWLQLNLLKEVKERVKTSVLRFEVRLGNRKKVKEVCAQNNPTLQSVFSKKLAQRVLLKHWEKINSSIPILKCDQINPESLLGNILADSKLKGPKDALAQVAATWLIACGNDTRTIRKLLEDRFGKHSWSRAKDLIRSPPGIELKSLRYIEESLKNFQSIKKN